MYQSIVTDSKYGAAIPTRIARPASGDTSVVVRCCGQWRVKEFRAMMGEPIVDHYDPPRQPTFVVKSGVSSEAGLSIADDETGLVQYIIAFRFLCFRSCIFKKTAGHLTNLPFKLRSSYSLLS